MGASNTTSSGNRQFFKLIEKKENDKPTGVSRFVQQEKTGAGWQGTNEFASLTGYLKGLEIKEYEWQGKKKEQLSVILADNESDKELVFALGLTTTLATNILNTLAGESDLGLLSFECGNPNEFQGKMYPTLYIKNNGQKTDWKYSKKLGNDNLIPKVTKTTDSEGNDIYTGKAANTSFWKGVIVDVNDKMKGKAIPAPVLPTRDSFVEELREMDSGEHATPDDDSLPF